MGGRGWRGCLATAACQSRQLAHRRANVALALRFWHVKTCPCGCCRPLDGVWRHVQQLHTPTHTQQTHTHTLARPRTAREIRKILFPLMKYSPAAGQGLLDVWHHFYEPPHPASPPPYSLPAFRVMRARMQSGIKAHRENVATNVDIARQDHRESSKKCPQRSQLALRMLQFV